MFNFRRAPALLSALLFATPLLLQAQSVAVSPVNAVVAPGGSIQFTKSTTMLSPEGVTWAVAGVPNGNSSVGSIDATGLYKAPASVLSAPVLITATSVANTAIVGTAAVAVQAIPSVTVKPANPSLGPGATVQFSVTVQNLASADVTWSLLPAGMAVGSITPTGLYTAPPVAPAQNPITVKATSKADGKTIGTTYVLLLTAGPTITAVTPNPLPSGSYTITVTGTGILPGALINVGGVQLTSTVSGNTVSAAGYQAAVSSTTVYVKNPGSAPSNMLVIPVSGASPNPNPNPNPSPTTPAPVVTPAAVTVPLGSTQQFTAANTTSWTATAGAITATGLYTAPAAMPASATVTITATGPGGAGKSTVTLIPSTPPAITSITPTSLPLGVFSTTVNGSGFIGQSVVQLNGKPLPTTFVNAAALTVNGFAGVAGQGVLTVVNGPLASPAFPVQIGVANPVVSASAARRFLQQAAFGPTPTEADHVQAVGFQAWINEQFNMPQVSNYNAAGNQGGLPTIFLANAVTNPDQLRQKVAFALSQIFVTSLSKLIWNATMIPYQHMLMADAFTNYKKILTDVTLSPAMGYYLDMANNAKANPAAGTVANENYAREVLQLFSIGTAKLNSNGTAQLDNQTPPQPVPAYDQPLIAEFARVFTGWTFAPPPGGSLQWGAYPTNVTSPMMPFPSMHDAGAKTLFNGAVLPLNNGITADLAAAIDNIATHANVAPFISKQLIQHLVMSNPSPAYVQRVVNAFLASQGDMKTVLSAILLDQEARANDEGGADLPADGHLQEPVLFLSGLVRAFGGQMTTANYYGYYMAALGQDVYTPASVFNYYSPGYTVANTNGLKGPEFQINNPNNAILRENLIANLFNSYQNPVQSNGPGTTIDLTAFVPLASTPATLVDALDLTLTHNTMPGTMKTMLVNAVTAESGGSLRRVQTAIYLTLQSSYYNVWH